MQLIKSIVCFLALAARICFAGLIIESTKLDEGLVEASIDILESCYTDRFGTVGLAGPSTGSILRRISLRGTVIPVTLINETSRVVSHNPVGRASRHKLQVFVVTVSNPRTLVNTLMQVKNSKWWNHMASFLLVTEIENGCSNAYEVLWEAWKMNLLNSKFMCLHQTRGRLIYTFNPYTSKAPVPWQQENTYEGIKGHVWTLFAREYREDDSRCVAMDFDKTSDVGGYEICAAVDEKTFWDAGPTAKGHATEQVIESGARMLINSINATWRILLPPENYRGNETIIYQYLVSEVSKGNCDFYFYFVKQSRTVAVDATYPLIEFDVAILTRYRGNKSQLDKIISVLDGYSRLGVVVVFLITLLFFKFYLRKPTILAIMDLVLLMCNAAISKIPRKLGPRIYFGSLLILVVTIQGIYQSQLATLLTSNVRLRNINSIEDLAQSDHTIYGEEGYRIFFNESTFLGRYHVTSTSEDCVEHVLRDSKAACISARANLFPEATQFKLHLSDESIGTISSGYPIRPDWPLEQRVNTIFRTAAASGILYFLQGWAEMGYINTLESQEYQYRHQAVKVMTVNTLTFAFVILAIGLGCATIVFIFEVALFDTTITKPRKPIRRRIRLAK